MHREDTYSKFLSSGTSINPKSVVPVGLNYILTGEVLIVTVSGPPQFDAHMDISVTGQARERPDYSRLSYA